MISPLPYHLRLRDYFKKQKKTWDWFAKASSKEEDWLNFKTNLLKNAYRMQSDSEPDLHERLQTVKSKLEIEIPVTLYQLQNTTELNAFISFQQSEAHLVFNGPVLKLLQGDEVSALLAHELSHLKLYQLEDGDYEITNRVISAIGNDTRSDDVYLETARYFRLYSEIFCDRGALLATNSEEATQSSLIKLHTGLEKVSAANYLQQAKEILQNDENIKATYDTHPENFIRVLAVHLWKSNPETANAEIAKLIEQEFDLENLDIFGQQRMTTFTKHVLNRMMAPQWMRTDANLALCRQYFSGYHPTQETSELPEWEPKFFKENVKEYFSYVLLDGALADSAMEDVPLGHAFELSEELGIKDTFNNIVKKEKKLTEKKLREMRNKAVEALSKMSDTLNYE